MSTPFTPPQIHRLVMAWGPTPYNGSRVQANIPREVYAKLFNGTCVGIHGAQICLITTFLHKLINECTRLGIPEHYDPDNEQQLAQLMQRLNFEDVERVRVESYDLGFAAGVEAARPTPGSPLAGGATQTQDFVPRGANRKPARDDSRSNGRRNTPRVRKGDTQPSDVGTNLPSDFAGRSSGAGEEAQDKET